MPIKADLIWGVLFGLRVRLVLLVACGLIPLSILVLTQLGRQRDDALAEAHEGIRAVARQAAVRQAEVLGQVRGLLEVLSAIPTLREFQAGACDEMLGQIIRRYPGVTSIWFATPDGRVPCSDQPSGHSLGMADRDYFQRALAGGDFVVSDYLIGRVSGRPVLATALAFPGPDGRIAGVAMAAVDIDWLHRMAEQAVGGMGMNLVLIDGKGTLLAEVPPGPAPIGQPAVGNPLVAAMLETAEGGFETVDNSGVTRLFAHVPLPGTNARLAVGLERATVLARVDRQRAVSLVTLVLAAVASLIAAIVAGEVLIVRRLDRLREVAARLGRGDLSVRAHLPPEVELRELAVAFNDMADSIERREKSHRDSEARFRDMAEVSSDWFWETGPDNRFTYISKGIALTGAGPEMFIGASREELRAAEVDPAELSGWETYAADIAARRAIRDFTYRIVAPDGSVRHLASSGKPVFDDKGVFVGYRGVGRDVTNEVEAELEMRRARAAAESANLAKSQFLAIMSHELRTPMTGVLGTMDLLADTGLTDEQSQWLGIMRGSAETLMTVLNDILDFSKIEAGQLHFEEMDFKLSSVTHEVASLFARLTEGKQLEFTVVADDLERRNLDDVRGDPVRLRQVLWNLIGNAVKFTQRGRIGIRVTVPDPGAEGLCVMFEVSDTGIGIGEEQREHLFEPFSQADASTTRRFGGTGLGLAICKRLVEGMGGAIGVTSVPDVGSTFWFTVRLERATSRDTASRGTAPPVEEVPVTATPRRVLLAEDNDLNRLLVTTMLRRMGHDVVAVENGLRVIEEIGRGVHDIVIMDLHMPMMTGEEAALRVRAMAGPWRDLPLVALTADAMPPRSERIQAIGFDACLTKPVDWRQLGEIIGRLTSARDGQGSAGPGSGAEVESTAGW
jgi:PAS domain S-box-containing protein